VETTTDTIIGSSAAIQALRADVVAAARSDAKVLLTGESGVGKDIAARVIHQCSARSHMPFVTINCVSVPDSLLEPELFGHVRGSFTGAYRDRAGLLETAHKGTVFLDEVCEMSPRMQALLLRFMETGEIQRVGSDRVQARVDVRVLAATNRIPEQLVESKVFRADLYYRLYVIGITIPPLRERREDVLPLFDHFLQTYAAARGIPAPSLSAEASRAVVAYDWPGNVRQLKNVAERIIVYGDGAIVPLAALPTECRRQVAAPAAPPPRPAIEEVYDRMVRKRESFWSVVYPAYMMHDLTRDDLRFIVKRGLQETAGNYKMLVELLNMRPTDYKRFLNFLRKHECNVPYARFRVAGLRRRLDDPFTSPSSADAPPPDLADVMPPELDDYQPTGLGRR
jgi:transcriptional regulator with PAS, ATPase and Fis domain